MRLRGYASGGSNTWGTNKLISGCYWLYVVLTWNQFSACSDKISSWKEHKENCLVYLRKCRAESVCAIEQLLHQSKRWLRRIPRRCWIHLYIFFGWLRVEGLIFLNSCSMTSIDPPLWSFYSIMTQKRVQRRKRSTHVSYHRSRGSTSSRLHAQRRAPRGTAGTARCVWNTVTGSLERSTKWALCVQDLSRQTQIRKPNKGESREPPTK